MNAHKNARLVPKGRELLIAALNIVANTEKLNLNHLKTRINHSFALLRQPFGRHSLVRA